MRWFIGNTGLRTLGLLAAAAICGISLVPAQTGPREDIVVTASASPVPYENAARPVLVLTKEDIRDLPAASVEDILRLFSAVEVRSRGPFGIQSDLSIRGSSFSQVLVLIDGVRINDSQTSHHNADLPFSLEEVERIEVLPGSGSSLYGADAFGGTVNIVTKGNIGGTTATIRAGQYGLVDASLNTLFERGRYRQSLSFSSARSSGFMFDRDFTRFSATSRHWLGARSQFSASFGHKEFGANGFYGPVPSRESTDQTLFTFNQVLVSRGSTTLIQDASYRTHGDEFTWDFTDPDSFASRHRTHAVAASTRLRLQLSEKVGLNTGVAVGGDRIGSTNLGRHTYRRFSGFAEGEWKVGSAAVVYPGLRLDSYSNFGNALSPAVSAGLWLRPTLRVRASAGGAFRIPTFTELYYSDPQHKANSGLLPEKAWSLDTGIEWFAKNGWVGTLTGFSRWENNVIDWVRDNPAQKWETANIRHISTEGLEASAQKASTTRRSTVTIGYSYTNVTADRFERLSKYTLDYARHSVVFSGSTAIPLRVTLGGRADFRYRSDDRHYLLIDARVKRRFANLELFVDCTNLLNRAYREVAGVDMPGRWLRFGAEIHMPSILP